MSAWESDVTIPGIILIIAWVRFYDRLASEKTIRAVRSYEVASMTGSKL